MWYGRRVSRASTALQLDAPGRTAEAVVPEPFAVEVQHHDDVAVVRPRGELDLASAATLRYVLDGISSPRHLVLDLSALSFIDSTGLHLLVALNDRAQREGFQLTLHAPAPPADRTIQLCGLDKALPLASIVAVIDSEPRDRGS
jgi:anti-anti-sigma factor